MSQVMEERRLDPPAIERLRAGVRGAVLVPGDGGYDDARHVWNAAADRRPAVVVRCTGVADVIRALEFARSEDLVIAVRGGGHSIPGFSSCDGGIVIDLGGMRGIRVDPKARTAHAQGGVTWGEFDRETQQFGLATTGGVVTTTGIAGLTLGGGRGWLARRFGLASDNLLSADVVTADGDFVRASADENPELFWALRGGGGNFGIVTGLEYRLHQVGPVVAGGAIAFDGSLARDAVHGFRDMAEAAPDELSVQIGLTAFPGGGPVAAMPACYADGVERGEKLLEPARKLGSPVMDQLGPLPYVVQQTLFDEKFVHGRCHYWSSRALVELTDDVIDIIVDRWTSAEIEPTPTVALEHMGGAVGRLPLDATAYANRQATYEVLAVADWDDPTADAQAHIEWTRSLMAAIEPYSIGSGYVNYVGEAGSDAATLYGDRLARLRSVKATYDPDNVFRLNQNIAPAT